MFQKVDDPSFVAGEHEVLRFWREADVFRRLQAQNRGKKRWSFLDGPITANNPMGVHHAWGRTYKDVYQRYFAMTGHDQRYQNGFDCQGLWVEVEVEKELKLGTKKAIIEYGIDRFVRACKQRVLKFAARQTEQSIRLGYWMEWDEPGELRRLAEAMGGEGGGSRVKGQESREHTYRTARGQTVKAPAEQIAARLGCPEWGGSYFTFSTENNETIWTFLKKCFERKKIYQGHDVMPWSGRGGSAYSQMEVADGRRLTTHRSCFVRFPIVSKGASGPDVSSLVDGPENQETLRKWVDHSTSEPTEYLLVWTTTPWTLTSNVACAVNPDLEYVKLRAKKDGAVYYFAKENLEYQRLGREFKEGFGRPEWSWPEGVPKLKTIAQMFKEQGGYEVEGTLKGADMVGWRYEGPFDDLEVQQSRTELSALQFAFQSQNLRSTREEITGPTFDSTATWRFVSAVDSPHERLRHFVDHMMYQWHGIISESSFERQEHSYSVGERLEFALRYLRLIRTAVRLSESVERFNSWIDRLSADAQQQDVLSVAERIWNQLGECLDTFYDEMDSKAADSPAQCHFVEPGGRDSKGTPIVMAGEGTGIVHIAPGCGDVDHVIGKQLGLPIIAPLQEDGTFGEGFGVFTGREAIDPATAELVFEELKKKGLLVYVETYPHIYPHCWRTGDELVFRLVDEWFINMDWREEIKDVTRQIEWLPDAIDGQEREIEWLTNMRDWMISKKRFWGLALPIWVNPEDPSDFEVIGSLGELRERAAEVEGEEGKHRGTEDTEKGEEGGWEAFEGHTPHRPWIDKVKIRSRKTGAVLSRVEDVGNPWLDAGIVPFSTLNYNEWKRRHGAGDRGQLDSGRRETRDERREKNAPQVPLNSQLSTLNWPEWYPADLVLECFPGQFRNWFYSLLSLSTMMRYDETDDPAEKRPFKTLFGHRLVMNEDGKPMHKSDGTAIWFEEAAEQLGVDTIRWMYCAQNPAADLRFGTRHPDEPVTLSTPEGPISETKEGLPCCRVTSKPADEVRRLVLLPLWNSYAFFVNYARLDEFDPTLPPVPVEQRPEIDQWILSNLQAFLATANERFQAFDAAEVCRAAAAFVDDLSNWYIRINRGRFWRSKDATDTDKLAAYQTLYAVLVTFTKAVAPIVPFLAERMYQNLVRGPWSVVRGEEAEADSQEPRVKGQGLKSLIAHPSSLIPPESVHLCEYPQADLSLLKPALNRRMALAERVVSLGRRLREEANLRVRQPLAELKYACRSEQDAADVAAQADVIADELNVKAFTRAASLDDLVRYSYKPNLKTLGPKYGKLLNALRQQIPALGDAVLAPLRSGQTVEVTIDGAPVVLTPEDVLVTTEQASDWRCAEEGGVQIALSTALTPELIAEGISRDFVRQVQQLRKDAGREITDRIRVYFATEDETVARAIAEWREYIAREVLADVVERRDEPAEGANEVSVGEGKVWVGIERM